MSILDNNPNLASEIEKIAEVAGYLWDKGWAERNGGNIVVNVTDKISEDVKRLKPISQPIPIGATLMSLKGCYFFCKGTQKRMRDLARFPMENGTIIRITEDCANYEIIADKPIIPTSEVTSHLSVHNFLIENGSSYKASVHTHPTELIAISHNPEFLRKDVLTHMLWSMIPETKAFAPRGLGIVPYKLPSSVELANSTIEIIADNYDVVLWEKHGVFAVDEDVMSVFDQIDVLNKSAVIYQNAVSMGFRPEGLTDAMLNEISAVFKLPK